MDILFWLWISVYNWSIQNLAHLTDNNLYLFFRLHLLMLIFFFMSLLFFYFLVLSPKSNNINPDNNILKGLMSHRVFILVFSTRPVLRLHGKLKSSNPDLIYREVKNKTKTTKHKNPKQTTKNTNQNQSPEEKNKMHTHKPTIQNTTNKTHKNPTTPYK